MFTKEQLKKQKLDDEQWQEFESKTINYFGRILKENTKEYDKFMMGDL